MEYVESPIRKKEKKHTKPSYNISVSTKDNPDLENYDVDDDITITMSGKVLAKRIMDSESKDKHMMVDMNMNKCKIIHEGDKCKMIEMGIDKKMYNKMKEKKMV